MAKARINPKQVREWALEHLSEPDGVAYNRYTRIAGRMQYLEEEIERLLGENIKLEFQLESHPIIAHRVKETEPAH